MDQDLLPDGPNERAPDSPTERPAGPPAVPDPGSSAYVWQLLDRARNGDRAAFGRFALRVTPGLSAQFRRCRVPEHLIDDLVQETLLRVYRGLPGFHAEGRHED